jgi:hypothetical protein
MKNKILVVCLILLASTSCQKHDSEDDKTYTSVKGNTYTAESPASWQIGTYIIYKLDNDSTIDIEERMYSVDGDLKNKSKGYFKYTHPTLKLRIQSISGCENCFNYYTATVNDDKKSFRYTIFDLGDSKNKIIEFKIKP